MSSQSKFLKFYSHAVLDLMCCCADVERQVGFEDEQSYYSTRSPSIPSRWMDESSSENSFPTNDENEPFMIKKERSEKQLYMPDFQAPRSRGNESFETRTTILGSRSYDSSTSENTLKSSNKSNIASQESFGGLTSTTIGGMKVGGSLTRRGTVNPIHRFQLSLTE